MNGNIEAINMVLNWEIMDIGEGVSVKSQKPINAGLWQVLSKTDKSCISYKYFSSELHLDIEFTISASMDKMISLFTVPAERKKWDLKLSEIELTDDSQYYFDYIFEKTHKIIPLKVEISEDPNYSKITFTMEKNNGFSSEIHIEQYESIQFDKQSLGSENTMIFSERSFKKDEDCDSLKVSWKLKCTGQYIDIYKSDIIQECMHLCKSIKLLIDAAENRDVSECHRGSFFIDKACSKKLLRRSIQF